MHDIKKYTYESYSKTNIIIIGTNLFAHIQDFIFDYLEKNYL